MFIPKYHALTDLEAMQSHIDQHPLGAWVCSIDGNLTANHIPFVLDRHHGSNGRLIGHVSRGNSVWKSLQDGTPSVIMFLGPQAYITPSWYPGKKEHGKVVPTWNYVAVHAHGKVSAIDDDDWKLDMLHQLTDTQESSRSHPWKVTDAPDEYVQKKLRAIVGIEMVIDRLEGRLKASQDEDLPDRYGTVDGLRQEQASQAHEMAELVRRQIKDN